MFIGHFGVAFGAKKYAPQISLGVFLLASQLADLIWPNLVLLGIETFNIAPGNTVLTPLEFTHYPFSHSLLALVIWGICLGGLYAWIRPGGVKAAVVIALVVVSHWILDFVTHRADMPLTLDESYLVGLSLWNYPLVAVPLELAIFGLGVWLYVRSTRALDKIGSIGLWGLVVFLLVVHAANVLSPPPPSVDAVAWSAQAMWLIVALGFWIDRHRKIKGNAPIL